MKIITLAIFALCSVVFTSDLWATEVTRYHVSAKQSQSSLVFDSSGNLLSHERLSSYGEVEHSNRVLEEWNHSYHGKLRHKGHGLINFGARFYDPELGRFLTIDPRGFRESAPDSFNRYAFANNNPYRYTDPDGRVVETVWDVANVGLGLSSLSSNLSDGDWSAAALDTVGLAYDGLASVIPFLPGGASAGIKAGRAVDSAASAAKSIDVPKGANKAPDFVVSPNGTTFPVPKGATGPTSVVNPAGKKTGDAFTGGSGGANGQVDTMRVMNPTPPRGNSPGYPNGYIKYENKAGQGVDPYSGRTLSNKDSHFSID